jgi:hypothetical protein
LLLGGRVILVPGNGGLPHAITLRLGRAGSHPCAP